MKFQTEYHSWHTRTHEADPIHDDASSPWYGRVRQVLPSVKGRRVLEVACGRGGFLRQLSRAGAKACGLGFSFAAVRLAKTKMLQGDSPLAACLVQGDAHSWPFPDNFCDVIVSCETIEHLPFPGQAMADFHRVARPGAYLDLTTPNYFNLTGLYHIYVKFRHPGRQSDQPFDRIQQFWQTRALLKRAGWRIIESDRMVYELPLFSGRNAVQLEKIDSNATLRKALRIFAYHYCRIAQKPILVPRWARKNDG